MQRFLSPTFCLKAPIMALTLQGATIQTRTAQARTEASLCFEPAEGGGGCSIRNSGSVQKLGSYQVINGCALKPYSF